MILEDLSCYSSPLRPTSRQCQQLWLDTEPTSCSVQELNGTVAYSASSLQLTCYGGVQRDTITDGRRYAPAVTESRYCSGDCPGSPCAVCRLLGDDVAPPSDYEDNRRQQQRCKLTRQVEPPSATPCDTPQHGSKIVDWITCREVKNTCLLTRPNFRLTASFVWSSDHHRPKESQQAVAVSASQTILPQRASHTELRPIANWW